MRPTRLALGAAAAAAVAALAAVILGEYTFTGVTPWAAGVVVPVAAAEAAGIVAGDRRPWRWAWAAVVAAGGLAWGVWLSTGRGLDPWPAGGWVAVVVGAALPLAVTARARRARRALSGR